MNEEQETKKEAALITRSEVEEIYPGIFEAFKSGGVLNSYMDAANDIFKRSNAIRQTFLYLSDLGALFGERGDYILACYIAANAAAVDNLATEAAGAAARAHDAFFTLAKIIYDGSKTVYDGHSPCNELATIDKLLDVAEGLHAAAIAIRGAVDAMRARRSFLSPSPLDPIAAASNTGAERFK